mmetsp:Transcript_11004/g.30419  ORF Transcript_11004/g.30419 Transcript_11004/m.30419 type:complete len:251 (-) Transcript_11004:234-986(-)
MSSSSLLGSLLLLSPSSSLDSLSSSASRSSAANRSWSWSIRLDDEIDGSSVSRDSPLVVVVVSCFKKSWRGCRRGGVLGSKLSRATGPKSDTAPDASMPKRRGRGKVLAFVFLLLLLFFLGTYATIKLTPNGRTAGCTVDSCHKRANSSSTKATGISSPYVYSCWTAARWAAAITTRPSADKPVCATTSCDVRRTHRAVPSSHISGDGKRCGAARRIVGESSSSSSSFVLLLLLLLSTITAINGTPRAAA